MSSNSPSKHDRVERHLMRQRGAGAREISACSGFAFAFPSSSSSAPENVSEEPPAKRRRIEPELEDSEEQDKPKKTKSRRRLSEVERPKAAPKTEDVDDSFVANVKSRKAKGKSSAVEAVKTKAIVATKKAPKKAPVTKPAEDTPASTKGRPKRKAATNAIAKVAEGFLEEAVSIDTKRRNPSPGAPERKRVKETTTIPDNLPDELSEEVPTKERQRAAPRKPTKSSKAKPVSKAATKISPTKREPLLETNANTAMASASPEKSSSTATSKWKPKDATVETTKTARKLNPKIQAKPKVQPKTTPKHSPESAPQAEGDVDWLCAPQQPKKAPERVVKALSTREKGKSAFKMAEIDLDDLISNITSYASTQQTVPRDSRRRKV